MDEPRLHAAGAAVETARAGAGDRAGQGSAHDRAAGRLVLAGVAGPLAYAALVATLGLLVDGYDPLRASMSELGAIDAPYRHIMNVVGFMGLGLAILAFATGFHLLLRRVRLTAVVTTLLVVAGTFMVAVGFFPCDPGCVDVTMTGRLHSLTSTPQAIALPAAGMVGALVFRIDGRLGPGWQAFSLWGGALALATGPLVAVDAVAAVGLLQRLGMGLSLLWMAAVALKLHRLTRTRPGRGNRRAGR